jgi:hypothetical protein
MFQDHGAADLDLRYVEAVFSVACVFTLSDSDWQFVCNVVCNGSSIFSLRKIYDLRHNESILTIKLKSLVPKRYESQIQCF